MNSIREILNKHETDMKHQPRCILNFDYEALACDLEDLISKRMREAYKDGYREGSVDELVNGVFVKE